jgi:hypothetical protein
LNDDQTRLVGRLVVVLRDQEDQDHLVVDLHRLVDLAGELAVADQGQETGEELVK